VVMGDVDGAQIPRLVDEEIDHIYDLENRHKYQGRLNSARGLILICQVAKVSVETR